jgi:hypothetical protein
MCFNSNSEYLPPQYFDGVLLPYTDSFKYLGMVFDKQINLNTAADITRFAHSRQARSESKSLFRNKTLQTGYTRTCGFSRHTLLLLVCMRVGFGPLLTYKRQRDGRSPQEIAVGSIEKDVGGQRHAPRLHGVSCESVN